MIQASLLKNNQPTQNDECWPFPFDGLASSLLIRLVNVYMNKDVYVQEGAEGVKFNHFNLM